MKNERVAVPEKSFSMAERFLKRAYKKLGEAEGHLKQINKVKASSISDTTLTH